MEPMANIALRAGRLAAQHIVRAFDRPDLIKVSSKGHNDFVTNIDNEAEYLVVQALTEKFPTHKITAEESGSNDIESEYEWVIDPLDGTTNFTRQIPHFCVSIACLYKGRSEHAVVVDPIRNEEFVASRGQGATLNGRKIRCSEVEYLDGAVIATGGRDRALHPEQEAALQQYLLGQYVIPRQPGSAALELAYVAAGRLDGMYMRGLAPWDMAAGVLLVTESGGMIGDFEGGANHMKTGNIIAGSPTTFKHLSIAVKKHLT